MNSRTSQTTSSDRTQKAVAYGDGRNRLEKGMGIFLSYGNCRELDKTHQTEHIISP